MAEKGFGAFVCYLHDPARRYRFQGGAEPSDVFGYPPYTPHFLDRMGSGGIKILVKAIVIFVKDELIRDISGEGMDSSAKVHNRHSRFKLGNLDT